VHVPQQQKIVIIGAGPTGLAAGYRLRELGHRNYRIFEARHKVGGLASSEVSPNGFTYDIGGHVLFSHYEYFDRLFDKLMGDEYKELVREAWVWMCGRFLPYPLQNNIKDLPKEVVLECLLGLVEAQKTPLNLDEIDNFEQLIMKQFGAGLAKYFMMPYNFKVWAHPPRMMNKEWIGERVALPKLERVLGNVIIDTDDAGWGPNSTFKYPLYGGTGGLFERMQPYVNDQLTLNAATVAVDLAAKEVVLEDGTREAYDVLLNTMPMDKFVALLQGEVPEVVRSEAGRLRHSGSFIVGVGVNQPCPSKKCWMYFPEDNAPFYRVTYLSNYSPEVVPDHTRQYSLLAEISHSEFKPENRDTIVEETLQGMVNTKLLSEADRADVVDAFLIERDYTYPTRASSATTPSRRSTRTCTSRGSSRAVGSAPGATKWATWTTRWPRGWSGRTASPAATWRTSSPTSRSAAASARPRSEVVVGRLVVGRDDGRAPAQRLPVLPHHEGEQLAHALGAEHPGRRHHAPRHRGVAEALARALRDVGRRAGGDRAEAVAAEEDGAEVVRARGVREEAAQERDEAHVGGDDVDRVAQQVEPLDPDQVVAHVHDRHRRAHALGRGECERLAGGGGDDEVHRLQLREGRLGIAPPGPGTRLSVSKP
jgi:protoporphyrinogen oxidase